jgi:hypothetical protein
MTLEPTSKYPTQAVWGLALVYRFVAFMTLKLKPVKPNLS